MSHVRTYVVGRGAESDVRLDDPTVSRTHAEVVLLADGRLYVTDRGATNGTFVLDAGEWRSVRQEFVEPDTRLCFGRQEISGARLQRLCAGQGVDGTAVSSAVRQRSDPAPDPNQGLARNPETGEIIERRVEAPDSGHE